MASLEITQSQARRQTPRTPGLPKGLEFGTLPGGLTSACNLFPVLNLDCTLLDFRQRLRNEPSGTPAVRRRSCPTAATESSDPHSLLLVRPTQQPWRPRAAAL